MNRRIEIQDAEDRLQRQTWYLAPGRYEELFLAGAFAPDPLTIAGRDIEEVVDDVDELDRYFDQLEQKRSVTGADVMHAMRQSGEGGWM